jgi:hypothetical protein
MKTIFVTDTHKLYKDAELFFLQKYQRGFLDPDAAILIDNAIDKLLNKDNIFRNENIPNEEQVVNEDDHITNTQEDEEEFNQPDESDEVEHIEDEDDFDGDDLERNDN